MHRKSETVETETEETSMIHMKMKGPAKDWILHLVVFVFVFDSIFVCNRIRLYFNIHLLVVKEAASDWILYLVHGEKSCVFFD